VLVHHDFTQTADFPLRARNVRFVPEPRRTGWANFGFVDGIFHSLRHALDHVDFDYLQLLSPTCMPIKPVREFEAHVAGGADAHFDCIDLLRDQDALMSVGYRAFTPEHSIRHRVLRRLSVAYFGDSTGRRDEAGVWLRTGAKPNVLGRVAAASVRALSNPSVGRHPFDEGLRPYYGSTWFGARRHVVAGMVDMFAQPGVRDYFCRLRIADEFLIPTMLMRLARRKGPLNHMMKRYQDAHTGCFGVEDMEALRNSRAFFARKFPDDIDAPVRKRVLRELVGVQPGVQPASLSEASAAVASGFR